MANKNIQIKGSFDASQILASFKKIRDEAAKSNISDKLLSGYDKELEKVEKLITQITAAQNRGLTDNQSLKEFARLVGQLEKEFGILNVKAQGFTDATNYKAETAEIRQYSNQLKTLIDRQKSLEKSARDYIDANSDALKLSKEESKALKQSISDAQAYKDVLDEIVQKRIDAAKQKIADKSLSTTGGSQKYAEITGQITNFTLSAADKKGRDTSRKSLVKRNGQFDETKAITVANQEYNRILEDAIVNNRTAEDALQEMIKTMRAYKLELGDTEEVQKKFAQDLASIKDAAWENHSNLTGNDKGAFTRVEHKVDAIRSNASGLYNNVSVVQNTQVGQTINQVNREKIKSETEYNRQVEQTISLQQRLRQQANDTAESIISGEKAEIAESQKNLEIKNAIEDSFNKIGQGAKQILSVTTAWRSLRNVVRNTFNDVKALDKSFASIAMVTEYSVKDMWQQYGQYAEMANRLGQSTQSVVEASGLYYQQGLKTNEVLKLTEETMKLATLAGLDFKEATSQMTAALRAFHMDMSEGAHVTDVYAEVAAHAAVDVQGLSEAMSATAAIANSAGMSFENTTAMLATMVEATQEAPKNLGTAMKTIIARFTELKENVAGTADSEFDDLDYNKVDKALKSVGVSLKDATGQFRNMDEVFLELSSKWNTLDRNSQRYIATIAAGSRQQSRFIALMENYERTMELVNVAQNSAGRSSQQFAKYQDTVEYRLNKIKNSWEQFRTSLLDSDAYKGALDAFGDFLNKLNNMSGAGLATLAGTWLTVGRGAIGNTISGWSDLASNVLGSVGNGGLAGKLFLGKANAKLNQLEQQRDSLLSEGNVDAAQEIDDQISQNLEQHKEKISKLGQNIGNILTTGITTAITTGLIIDDPLKAGLTAGATSLTSLLPTFIDIGKTLGAPMGLGIGTAVTLGLTAISAGISAWRKHLQEEENKQLSKQLDNTKKQLDSQKQLLEQLSADRKGTQNEIKNLEDIKKKYDELNSKIILNEEEQQEYNELVENLKENYPSLISQYDVENNKIKISNDLLDSKVKKLQAVEKQQKKTELQASLATVQTEQRLEKLNLEDKYSQKIKDEFSKISPDTDISTDEIRNIYFKDNEENSDILEAFKNETSKFTEIKSILSDFKKEYEIVNKRQKKETFNEWAVKIQDLNPEMSSAAVAYRAKRADEINSTTGLKELFEVSSAFHDFSGDQIKQMGFSFGETLLKTRSLGADYKKYKDIDRNSVAYEALQSLNIKSQKDLDEWRENTSKEDQMTLLQDTIKTINQTRALDKINEKEIEQFEKDISDIQKDLNKKTTSEILKEAEKLKEKYGEEAIEYVLPTQEFKKYQELLEQYGLKNSTIFQKLNSETQSQIGSIFSNLEKKFGKNNNELGKTYEDFLNSIKSLGLSEDLTNILFKVDPSQLSGLTIRDAKETLLKLFDEAVQSGEIGKDAAEKTVDQYLDKLQDSGITSFSIKSTITLEGETKKVEEKLNNIVTKYKAAIDTINSSISSNGFIDVLDKQKIDEAIAELGLKASDYYFTDKNGNFQINVEKLNKDIKEQALNQKEIAKQLEAEAKLGLQELKQEQSIVNALLDQMSVNAQNLNISKNQTKELAKQAAIMAKIQNPTSSLTVGNILQGIGATETDNYWTITPTERAKLEERSKTLETSIKEYEKIIKDGTIFEDAAKNIGAFGNEIDKIYKTHTDTLDNLKKENDKAYKDWQDKTKAVTDAQKSLAKAIETVAEKQKELKATIEGTNWKSSIDGMYNYNTALDFLTKQTERAKKDLEKASTIDAAKRNFAVYGQGLLDQKAQLQAQNQIYRTAYSNIGKVYNNDVAKIIKSFEDSGQMKFNLADYLVFDEKTGTKINMNALQKAKMPEALKKWIETQGQKANEYLTKIWDNDDKVKQLNEEFIEHQRQALDGYVELQDKMIEVLREKYQKQVDDLRTKYEAMNEADDQYVDALQKNIDKQRKLRDQERSWNDLENKERKLALLRRDTSRGNAVEVRSLEKEVQDDRTSLLDSAVDDIIEKLREFYELQKEQRELEITYQEALIDDVALMKEATEALQKIQTSDELVNWWKKNVTEMEKMSDEKLQKEKQDWAELFKKKTDYVTSVDDTVLASIQNSEKNLKDVADKTEEIVRTTSEGITELASKSLEEAGEEYKKAVKTAKDALQDAVDAVAKQKEALQAAIEAANESKKAFDDIAAKYKEALGKPQQTITQIYKSPDGTTFSSMEKLADYENSKKATTNNITSTTKPVYKTPDGGTYSNYAAISQNSNLKTKTFVVGQRGDTTKMFNSDTELFQTNNSIMTSSMGKGTIYTTRGQVTIPEVVKHGVLTYNEKDKKWELLKPFDKLEDAEKYIKQYAPPSMATTTEKEKYRKNHLAFAEGGLVNFTGPAWVDGSRSRPEAFLSAEDTRRIGEAARILADLPILSQPVNQEQLPTTTIGDTTIQIDVHVDSIASDYDLDEAMNKVEKRIVEAAKYTGSNVILKKR